LLWLLVSVALGSTGVRADEVKQPHVQARLIVDNQSIKAGSAFRVGLWLKLERGWHVYWKNPGDSGMAPKFAWQLPTGFTKDDIAWPVPERIPVGPLVNYGYSDRVLFAVTMHAPKNLTTPQVEIGLRANWLVCEETCIPGKGTFTLTLPVSAAPANPSAEHATFEQWKTRLPLQTQSSAQVQSHDDALVLRVDGLRQETLYEAFFFPEDAEVIQAAAAQRATLKNGVLELTLPKAETAPSNVDALKGVLRVNERAFEVHAMRQKGFTAPPRAAAQPKPDLSLIVALLLAFAGGAILNFMPCVFPVLSLKTFNLVQQMGESKSAVRKHGWSYTAGVVASFWAFAAALLMLKAGGKQLGWGFQLQSPGFVAFLAGLLFVMALNLLGVFEIGASLTGSGEKLTQSQGLRGSFFTGVLATVVATPCTAPFMGTALGFALTQSGWILWSVFTALGAGLAAPFLLLSYSPLLSRVLPRPGRWMETLKHCLAFPLLATVVWLVWVFGSQTSVDALVWLLATLLLLAIAAYVLGRFHALLSRLAAAVIVVAAIATLFVGLRPKTTSSITWKPYSSEALDDALAQGKPVFIDFTAAWCVTCKVNERLALNTPQVAAAFTQYQVVPLIADWTNEDATITKALTRYGRSGVPLYILHSGKAAEAPRLLPQVLTPELVIRQLRELAEPRRRK